MDPTSGHEYFFKIYWIFYKYKQFWHLFVEVLRKISFNKKYKLNVMLNLQIKR